MTSEEAVEYRNKLIELVPQDGASVSNTAMLSQLKVATADTTITLDDYWEIRQPLIDEGLIAVGRGYGGTVKRVTPQVETATELASEPTLPLVSQSEASLYEPFVKSMESFAKAEGLDSMVLLRTAMQGRRQTGGKWTRPDVTLAAVKTYEFIPGKHLEVISFEIKPDISTALEGVFEALAHSAFAHRSYLAVKTEQGETSKPNQDLERVSSECARHGVGLYTFTDASDFATFELLQDAQRRNADPAKVNAFLATQVDPENKARVRAMVR